MPITSLDCPTCGQPHRRVILAPGTVADCVRCGFPIARRGADSLHRTAAFAAAAIFMYLPANLFPILRIHLHGRTTDNTALQGSIKLFDSGDYVIAVVVFLASILIPLLKLLGLLFLVTTVRWKRGKVARARLSQWIDRIGRWAMLDVFMVAILVSLVKLQGLATITAGPGLLAFGLLVVLTTLASQSFDSTVLWEQEAHGEGHAV